MSDKTELNEEDKSYIKENWSKLSLLEMTRHVSKNPEADGRHFLGKLIKEYIVNECGGNVKTTKVQPRKVELTTEQKTFLENNYKSGKTLEIAKMLFPNSKITNLNKEFFAVQAYIKEIDPAHMFDEGEYAEKDYAPPTTIPRLLPKVNKAVVRYFQGTTKLFKEETLTEFDKKCMNALLSYLNTPRLSMQINNYAKEEERELFETNFIRYTFDKPDLIQEDVDQYIVLCDEIVSQQQIIKLGQVLDREVDEHFQQPADENGKKLRLSDSLVEMIHKNQQKLNDSRNRADKLLKDLTGARAKRLENKQFANASIINLVNAWQQEKTRMELIELAEKQKLAEGQEVEKIANMDAVVALIAGVSKERAKH